MRRPAALLALLALLAPLVPRAAAQAPLQRRVARELLEYFHGRGHVQHLFQERSVDGVVEREDASGTFVRLRLNLVQTNCPKRAPKKQNCRVLETKRKPVCLGCFKFDHGDVPKELDSYKHCAPSHHLAAKEIKQRDERECQEVEAAGRAADAHYLPGMFAFSHRLPD